MYTRYILWCWYRPGIYIRAVFFQRKSNIFRGHKKPTGSYLRSDNSVSVGPRVNSYARYVPILRTFFITKILEPLAPFWPDKKKSKLFQGESRWLNFSREWTKLFQGETKHFPGRVTILFHGEWQNLSREWTKLFLGLIFQGNRGMLLLFSCAGVDEYGPVRYPGPPRGPDEVATRLERPDPCVIWTTKSKYSFWCNSSYHACDIMDLIWTMIS